VGQVTKAIEAAFPGATVTSAKDLAANISGSLVDANDIVGQFGSVIAIVVLITAFALAALLTLSSVAKRVRELGTLKAIGWRQRTVVRQIVGESAVVGLLGGVLGAIIGVGAAALAAGLMPSLEASTSTSSGGLFGVGAVTRVTSNSISLTAPVSLGLLLGALALAVVGGLVAGTVGALRAARLRPADALRELG
jgi:ABC-type antimicrobial peptide transport system permease subunit